MNSIRQQSSESMLKILVLILHATEPTVFKWVTYWFQFQLWQNLASLLYTMALFRLADHIQRQWSCSCSWEHTSSMASSWLLKFWYCVKWIRFSAQASAISYRLSHWYCGFVQFSQLRHCHNLLQIKYNVVGNMYTHKHI